MIKSWIITIAILVLLAGAYSLNVFQWLASGSALILGLVLIAATLGAAFWILGNPFKR